MTATSMRIGDKLVCNADNHEFVVVEANLLDGTLTFVNEGFYEDTVRMNWVDDLVASGQYSHIPAGGNA